LKKKGRGGRTLRKGKGEKKRSPFELTERAVFCQGKKRKKEVASVTVTVKGDRPPVLGEERHDRLSKLPGPLPAGVKRRRRRIRKPLTFWEEKKKGARGTPCGSKNLAGRVPSTKGEKGKKRGG